MYVRLVRRHSCLPRGLDLLRRRASLLFGLALCLILLRLPPTARVAPGSDGWVLLALHLPGNPGVADALRVSRRKLRRADPRRRDIPAGRCSFLPFLPLPGKLRWIFPSQMIGLPGSMPSLSRMNARKAGVRVLVGGRLRWGCCVLWHHVGGFLRVTAARGIGAPSRRAAFLTCTLGLPRREFGASRLARPRRERCRGGSALCRFVRSIRFLRLEAQIRDSSRGPVPPP